VIKENQITESKIPSCNCRNNNECPLNGTCRNKEVVYQATVKTQSTKRKYIGLCETEFKTRWYNHRQSFKEQKTGTCHRVIKILLEMQE